MTGSGLLDFLITIVVLIGAGVLFFISIDRMAPDPFMNRIAKVAVGVTLLVILLIGVKAVLFGGGAPTVTGGGIVEFAIGLIVILVVLFLIDKALAVAAAYVSPLLAEIVRYVVFAIALIALLVLFDKTFFRGAVVGRYIDLGSTPQIMRPEKR